MNACCLTADMDEKRKRRRAEEREARKMGKNVTDEERKEM